AARGGAVTVLTKRVDRLPPREELDGVPVYRVGPAGRRGAAAKWQMLPFAAAALLRLRRAYDVIYCPDPRGIGIAAVLVGRLLGRRVVFEAATPGDVSCANWDDTLRRWSVRPAGRLAAALKWLPRRMYTAADAIACLSGEIEEECRAAGVAPARLLRVAHALDLTRFRPGSREEAAMARGAFGLPTDRLVCLFVGRLSREKGVLEILQAWHAVRPEGALLVLAGPDTPEHALDVGAEGRAFTARHGLEEQVRFLGPVAEPASLMRAADVFIHPSHYEAFGLSVAEALASGLPVIATSVGGLKEYLVDEENALLVPPGEPDELGRQLDRLLGDAALRQRLGRAGRQTAERRFGPDRVFGALFAALSRPAAEAGRF
ncbi:MAG: glycosyltransferase family 4 protein, partial [Gemmatimonadetes bacterium]|nr:glycosyltransferase family 4 protein [Gemmatimonadota bacterium]